MILLESLVPLLSKFLGRLRRLSFLAKRLDFEPQLGNLFLQTLSVSFSESCLQFIQLFL